MVELKNFISDNLKNILNQEPVDYSLLAPDQHQKFYEMARAHGIYLFVYDTFKRSDTTMISSELLNRWKSRYLRKSLDQQMHVLWLKKIYKGFERENINVMMLKGIAYASYYKNPFLRRMSDYDLLVKVEDVEAAGRVLEELGYWLKDDGGVKSHHLIYKHPSHLKVELHTKLICEDKYPALAKLSQDIYLGTHEQAYMGFSYTAPSLENALIYCLAHMYKHYYEVGFGYKQLCDVYWLASVKGMDWAIVFQAIETYKIKSFSCGVFHLIHKYFDLTFPKSYHQAIHTIDNHLIDLFMDDIYKSGASGLYDKEKYLSNHIADHEIKHQVGKSKWKAYIKFLFPDRKYMLAYKENAYLRTRGFLLPLAWLQRIVRHIKKGHLKKAYINKEIIDNRTLLKNWIIDE